MVLESKVLKDGMEEIIRGFMKDVATGVTSEMDSQLTEGKYKQIKDLLTYQHNTGGKRLRPALAVMFSMAFNGDKEKSIKISSICEMLHTASLYFDDVVDLDTERRGKPTAMAIFGNSSAVMGGITIVCQTLLFAMANDLRLLQLTLETIIKLVVGNAEELLRINALDEDQYRRVIENKTASLYVAACQMGAILAGEDEKIIAEAGAYGNLIGTMYQLCDDVTDVVKTIKKGRPIGDMKLGVITLSLIHTYRTTENDEIRSFVKDFVSHQDVEDHQIMKLCEEIENLKSVEYIVDEIEEILDEVDTLVDGWPENEYTRHAPRDAFIYGEINPGRNRPGRVKVDKKRYIIGEEGCPTCERLENYLSNHPKDDTFFFKMKAGDPDAKPIIEVMAEAGLNPETVPFCVEFNEKRPQMCSVDSLLDEMFDYADNKKT